MIRRLFSGLLVGLLIGSLAAASFVSGLRLTHFEGTGGVVLAYLASAIVGVCTGLVAGTPIWKPGAKVEGGLKAFFGALAGAACMFALRRWATGWVIDLHAFGAGGPAAVGSLPAVSLPLLAAALGAFFGLDDTKEPEKARLADSGSDASAPVGKRVAGSNDSADESEADAADAARRGRR